MQELSAILCLCAPTEQGTEAGLPELSALAIIVGLVSGYDHRLQLLPIKG